jgi:hypothetical protein
MFAAVGEDLPVLIQLFVEQKRHTRRVRDLEGSIRKHGANDAVRQAAFRGPSSAEILVAAPSQEFGRSGLQRHLRTCRHIVGDGISEIWASRIARRWHANPDTR